MPLIVNKVFCMRIIPGQTPEEERPVVADVLGKVAQTLYEPPIKLRVALVAPFYASTAGDTLIAATATDRRAPQQEQVVRRRRGADRCRLYDDLPAGAVAPERIVDAKYRRVH